MFRRRTVFLLGAGASVPFGFPTGAKLRRDILKMVNYPHSDARLRIRTAGISEEELQEFARSFERAGGSIDSFIARRPEFQKIGEYAIAAILQPLETLPALYSADGNAHSSDWYEYLWNQMCDGAATLDQVLEAAPGFVTFNYDRSLEQYLHQAMNSTFGLGYGEDADPRIPVHHVYGSISTSNASVLRYGMREETDLQRAVLSIKTMPLVRPERDEVASKMLRDAERIIVLGFGFDKLNCSRIGLYEALQRDKVTTPVLYTTAFGLEHSETVHISLQFPGVSAFVFGAPNVACLRFLRQHAHVFLR